MREIAYNGFFIRAESYLSPSGEWVPKVRLSSRNGDDGGRELHLEAGPFSTREAAEAYAIRLARRCIDDAPLA